MKQQQPDEPQTIGQITKVPPAQQIGAMPPAAPLPAAKPLGNAPTPQAATGVPQLGVGNPAAPYGQPASGATTGASLPQAPTAVTAVQAQPMTESAGLTNPTSVGPAAPMVLPQAPSPTLTQTPSGVAAPPIAGTPASMASGTSLTPFTADQNLLQTQIAPSNTGATRYDVAGQQFDEYAAQTDPAYQAAIRAATQAGAANGRIGSGMLSTSYGDLALNRTHDLDNQRQQFLTQALNNSFGDAAANRDELRTERGYQSGLDSQAFQQALQQLLVGDELTNSANNRNVSSANAAANAGFGEDPTRTLLAGSSAYGSQADASNAALMQWLASLGYGKAA